MRAQITQRRAGVARFKAICPTEMTYGIWFADTPPTPIGHSSQSSPQIATSLEAEKLNFAAARGLGQVVWHPTDGDAGCAVPVP